MFKRFLVTCLIAIVAAITAGGQDDYWLKRREANKAAIIRQINAYLAQFNSTCFGKAVTLGDLALFQAAIEKNINQIKVGALGEQSLRELSKSAMAMHHTYKLIGVNADLLFAFDPGTLPAGEAGFKNRQRLVHEMTHHIEFLRSVKYSSKTLTGANNPYSERNSDYQDRIVDQLKILKKMEAMPDVKIGQRIVLWQAVQREMAELEKGSAAEMNPHDANLKAMTGFSVDMAAINDLYMRGKCGVPLQDMAHVSVGVDGLKATLEVADLGPSSDGSGEKYRAEVSAGDDRVVNIPPEFKPRYVWTLPDKAQLTGQQVTIPLQKPGNGDVLAKLVFKVGSNEYELADSMLNAKTGTATKAPSGYAGNYVGTFQGGLTTEFEFTITKTGPDNYTVLGKFIIATGREFEILGENQSLHGGVFYTVVYDKSYENYRQFRIGEFNGSMKGGGFGGNYAVTTFEKKYSGSFSANRVR